MITKEKVLEALKQVIDFEIGLDIVNLGLVYDVAIDNENNVTVTMTMTTPACPLAGLILQDAEDKVRQIEGVKDVKINLTFDPPWTPDRMSEEIRKKFGI
ncbi:MULTISPECIES: metal-sulfur cluster assembly factor [Pseudothermotoga]|uniref:metal-sulfur cluster assembly factor n=1 Tax=Pseudothermotoga TaxID=1643951 RepID=UPI000428D1ED|nr:MULTISPECIES: metal-sulfur cluster assembly factor [Pseudothermotoga]MDI6863919.1 metal-sulfur cluster assembly factor [Pseudothermotoga sp.]